MCKKIIDKCCKIRVCAACAASAPHFNINLSAAVKMQVGGWSLKNGTVLVKRKQQQHRRRRLASFLLDSNHPCPSPGPGAAPGQNKNYTSLVSGGNQHRGTLRSPDSRNWHQTRLISPVLQLLLSGDKILLGHRVLITLKPPMESSLRSLCI